MQCNNFYTCTLIFLLSLCDWCDYQGGKKGKIKVREKILAATSVVAAAIALSCQRSWRPMAWWGVGLWWISAVRQGTLLKVELEEGEPWLPAFQCGGQSGGSSPVGGSWRVVEGGSLQ
jgi:hypothetical protein